MARLVRDEGVVLAREDFLETDLLMTLPAVYALILAFLQSLGVGRGPGTSSLGSSTFWTFLGTGVPWGLCGLWCYEGLHLVSGAGRAPVPGLRGRRELSPTFWRSLLAFQWLPVWAAGRVALKEEDVPRAWRSCGSSFPTKCGGKMPRVEQILVKLNFEVIHYEAESYIVS